MPNSNTTSNKQNLFQWISVLALFIFTVVAGFLGFQQYMVQHGESFSWVRPLYRAIQLFSTEGGDLEEPIPNLLHVARFTAPLTAIVAIILALLAIFSEQLKRLRISWMRNHVVIIGLGTKGKNVMKEYQEKRKKLLVIEKDPLNPHLASLKNTSRHIIGDSTNINILKRARIIHAKKVYLLMGDDSQQITACLLIYDLIKNSKRDIENPLDCFMHLINQESLHTLRNHKLVQNINDGLSLNVFNVYENAARELYQKYPPDHSGLSELDRRYVQLIIFGFGEAGETLALQSAITGHYLNWRLRSPKVVVFDRLAEEKVRDFKKRYPAFTDYCDLIPKPTEADSPQLITELASFLNLPDSLNTVVLCFDNPTVNMLLGLQIESLTQTNSHLNLKVFSRTNDNDAFKSFTSSITPYGLPSNVCSQSAIQEGELDSMAMDYHKYYLNIRKTEADFGSRPADFPWKELSQEYRDSNRKAADHIGVKIRAIGCQIVSEDDSRNEAVMTETELRLLSELEHRRWNAERSLAGWTYSPDRNNGTRKTPYLIDWSKLSPDIQKYDRDAVENIPNVLKVAKKKIVRTPIK